MEAEITRPYPSSMRVENEEGETPSNREHDEASPLASLRFANISGAFGQVTFASAAEHLEHSIPQREE